MRGTTRQTEFRVGMFVLLGFFAIAIFSFRLTESPVFQRGIEVTTYLDDATGLFKLTKVKQAGISIGYVKEIELENNRAKVTLVIEHGYKIPRGAHVIPRPLGVLGDKYIEVRLPEQGEKVDGNVGGVHDEESHTSLQWKRLVDWLIPSASAQEAQTAVTVAPAPRKKPAARPAGGLIRSGDVIDSSPSSGSMDDLTKDASDLSKDLKETSTSVRSLVKNNTSEIESLIRSWNRITTKLEKTLNRVDADRIAKDLDDLSLAAGKMGQTLQNTESITSKIDRGEGTLGKLVNDPTTVQELNRALSHLNHAIERSRRIQTIVDMNGDYRPANATTKTWIGLKIMTRETSGYIAQIVVDPVGTEKKSITRVAINGGAETVTETTTNDRSALKYSVQFYKRIGEIAFRLGLFENSGGIAVDTYFLRDRVQASMEVFEIGRPNDNSHIQAYLRVPFFTFLYAQVGGDELITRFKTADRKRSFTAGLGLRFTDDDIKTLFLLPGIP